MIFLALFLSKVGASCSNICVNVSNPVVCSTSGHCGKGLPGDFDYFVFSQLYHPAYCDALSRGFDPTVSHAPGARCVRKPRRSLQIHGLWPNYVGGFCFCCNKTVTIDEFDIGPFFSNLSRFWSDPVDSSSNETICGLWQHELEKHGSCVALNDASLFFAMSLDVDRRLRPQITAIEQLLRSGGGPTTINANDIRSLFNTTIQLVCDATSGGKQLLELRTCWNRGSANDSVGDAIDCQPLTRTKTELECGKSVILI